MFLIQADIKQHTRKGAFEGIIVYNETSNSVWTTSTSEKQLLILGAFFINDTWLSLNTKDQYKSQVLVIKF